MRTFLGNFLSLAWIVVEMFFVVGIVLLVCLAFELLIWLLALAKLRNLEKIVARYYERMMPEEFEYYDEYEATYYQASNVSWDVGSLKPALQPAEKVDWKTEGF